MPASKQGPECPTLSADSGSCSDKSGSPSDLRLDSVLPRTRNLEDRSDRFERDACRLTVDSVQDEAAKAIPCDRLLKPHVFAKSRKTA